MSTGIEGWVTAAYGTTGITEEVADTLDGILFATRESARIAYGSEIIKVRVEIDAHEVQDCDEDSNGE